MNIKNKRLKVLTWHIHGSYLYYLTAANVDFILPKKDNGEEGYGGKSGSYSWGENVFEIPAEEIKNQQFDLILFQSPKNYLSDQIEILNPDQRNLPKIYLEHNPPRYHPTDTKHWVNDKTTLIIHVTYFNKLMWNNGDNPVEMIEHGVIVDSETNYSGILNKGVVIVNNLDKRGRRMGWDIFEKVRREVPLDLVGIGSENIGGLGEIDHLLLPNFLTKYRFFFYPARYTSLSLSMLEAMAVGLPIVALETTETSNVIENYVSGFTGNNVEKLIAQMKVLLHNFSIAKEMGRNARKVILNRFNLKRFANDWERIFWNQVLQGKEKKENYSMMENFGLIP